MTKYIKDSLILITKADTLHTFIKSANTTEHNNTKINIKIVQTQEEI